MVKELWGRGGAASKPRVERLMRDHGIRVRHSRRDRVTTDSTHNLPVASNRLNWDFTPSAPNQTWTSDIATDALTVARFGRKPSAGLQHHSDRGSPPVNLSRPR